MAAAPPSARSGDAGGWAEAAVMASVMSRTWNAMASTQARASWARPAPRVRPVMMPRAGRVPLRAAQSGQGGDEDDAAAVAHRGGQRSDLGRLGR